MTIRIELPTRITAAWLRTLRDCPLEVSLFEKEWPDGAEINLANVRRAFALHLSIEWLLSKLLSYTALAAYKEAVAPAWAAYKEAIAPALAAYDEALALALAAYAKAVAPARAAYDEAVAPAWAAYAKAVAQAEEKV